MIEVKHLTKQYGDHTAVSDLSFTIDSGQIYGFLGPNGAGKSTTMNILTGCLAATSGEVRINGFDIYEDANRAKKCIGYLPEQPPLYTDMTPKEYLRFVGQAKGLHRAALNDQVRLAMERTQITEMQDRLIRHLSKGYKQRVGIAQALLGDPEIVILDEPTVGLDPKQIIEIRDLIQDLGRDHTVILSSHILSEVQAVCDVVMIIAHGRLVASDTPENLSRLLAGSSTLHLTVRAAEEDVRAALEPIEGIELLTVTPSAEEDGALELSIQFPPELDLREPVFFAMCDARLPVLAMNLVKISLEDVFLELTADAPEEEPETYIFPDGEAPEIEEAFHIPDAPLPDLDAAGGGLEDEEEATDRDGDL